MGTLKLFGQRLLLTTILVFAAWFCWVSRDTLAKVFEFSVLDILVILACYVSVYLLNAVMACMMLKSRGRTVSLRVMLAINCWSSLLGHATVFRAGYYSGKAWYYRQLYQVPVSTSLGLMAFLSLAMILANSMMGLLTGAWALIIDGIVVPPLYWLVLTGALLLCVVTVVCIHNVDKVTKLPTRVQLWMSNVVSVFKSSSVREVLAILSLTIMTIPLQVLALTLIFRGFDQEVPQVYLVFIAIFSGLSLIISLTPSNLGIRELVILVLVSHLDISAVEIVSILVVDRILQFLLILVLGLSGYQRLRQLSREQVLRNESPG